MSFYFSLFKWSLNDTKMKHAREEEHKLMLFLTLSTTEVMHKLVGKLCMDTS